MELSKEIESEILCEYKTWENRQYAGKSKKERQEKGQFFTPPILTIAMLKKLIQNVDPREFWNKTILDPSVGCGGLIAACIIAGANPENCYGIEIDKDIAIVCRKRLNELCQRKFGKDFPSGHINIGDATNECSYNFGDDLFGPESI